MKTVQSTDFLINFLFDIIPLPVFRLRMGPHPPRNLGFILVIFSCSFHLICHPVLRFPLQFFPSLRSACLSPTMPPSGLPNSSSQSLSIHSPHRHKEGFLEMQIDHVRSLLKAPQYLLAIKSKILNVLYKALQTRALFLQIHCPALGSLPNERPYQPSSVPEDFLNTTLS